MTNVAKPPERRKSWRDALPVHPAADLFPLMEGAQFDALVADIKANGLIDPIILYEDMILDGRNRYRACLAAGVSPGFRVAVRSNDEKPNLARPLITDPYAYVLSANIHRRHLTAEQKRELIEKVLKAKPEASNLQIAKQVKADDKTVGKVRRELEGRSEIPNVEERTDTRGRKQPAKKKRRDVDDFLAEKRAREAKEAAGRAARATEVDEATLRARKESAERIRALMGAPKAPTDAPGEPMPEPGAAAVVDEDNPIHAAWRKATVTQRKWFVRAFAKEILRLQQVDGRAADRIREAEEQRAAKANTNEGAS
jgi:ParB-like nuclease domain